MLVDGMHMYAVASFLSSFTLNYTMIKPFLGVNYLMLLLFRRTLIQLWGRGSQEPSQLPRSGWTNLTQFSVVPSATTGAALNVACKQLVNFNILIIFSEGTIRALQCLLNFCSLQLVIATYQKKE